MLMGGMYLAIDATAGERERGSLEPLLTVPVPTRVPHLRKDPDDLRVHDAVTGADGHAFAIVLQFVGLARFGMSVELRAAVALKIILCCLPLVPLGAALMTIVAVLHPQLS